MTPTSELVAQAGLMFGVLRADITGRAQHREAFEARAAVALAAHEAGRSYSQIGRKLGDRHHSSMMHAVRRARQIGRRNSLYLERCRVLINLAKGE